MTGVRSGHEEKGSEFIVDFFLEQRKGANQSTRMSRSLTLVNLHVKIWGNVLPMLPECFFPF
jgi:hypothetical protein